jgi:hypothetical protein
MTDTLNVIKCRQFNIRTPGTENVSWLFIDGGECSAVGDQPNRYEATFWRFGDCISPSSGSNVLCDTYTFLSRINRLGFRWTQPQGSQTARSTIEEYRSDRSHHSSSEIDHEIDLVPCFNSLHQFYLWVKQHWVWSTTICVTAFRQLQIPQRK